MPSLPGRRALRMPEGTWSLGRFLNQGVSKVEVHSKEFISNSRKDEMQQKK
jgi:hypothetical protein